MNSFTTFNILNFSLAHKHTAQTNSRAILAVIDHRRYYNRLILNLSFCIDAIFVHSILSNSELDVKHICFNVDRKILYYRVWLWLLIFIQPSWFIIFRHMFVWIHYKYFDKYFIRPCFLAYINVYHLVNSESVYLFCQFPPTVLYYISHSTIYHSLRFFDVSNWYCKDSTLVISFKNPEK